MSLLAVVLFFICTWGLGFSITRFVKESENFLGIGLLGQSGEAAENLFNGGELFALVVDDKGSLIPELVDVLPQNADAKRMESADRGPIFFPSVRRNGASRGPGNEFGHSFLHFARGLVREGHGHDVPGRDALPDQMGDAMSDDARLARAGAGQHKRRPFCREDSLALLRIQVVQ